MLGWRDTTIEGRFLMPPSQVKRRLSFRLCNARCAAVCILKTTPSVQILYSKELNAVMPGWSEESFESCAAAFTRDGLGLIIGGGEACYSKTVGNQSGTHKMAGVGWHCIS